MLKKSWSSSNNNMIYNKNMKRIVVIILCSFLFACANKEETIEEIKETEEPCSFESDCGPHDKKEVVEEVIMKLMINEEVLEVEWENNEAVEALKEIVKENDLSIQLSKYGGFEQVGDIGYDLPTSDTQITTEPGDIMLYTGNQMVIFYGNNSWSYTRLGKIKNKSNEELKELLGNEDIIVNLIIDN